MTLMTLDDLLDSPPLVHQRGQRVWALDEDTLRYLDGLLGGTERTIETGLGLSTVLFATRAAHHVCVTPSKDQVDRLRSYCDSQGVDLSAVTFLVNRSQDALPTLARRLPSGVAPRFDVALIDGGHGFPVPFLDWYYLAERLQTGGILVVDDTQIWTGAVLRDFLLEEPGWREEQRFACSSVFRLLKPFDPTDWTRQPWTLRRSRWSGRRARVHLKLRKLVRRLQGGELRELFSAILRAFPPHRGR